MAYKSSSTLASLHLCIATSHTSECSRCPRWTRSLLKPIPNHITPHLTSPHATPPHATPFRTAPITPPHPTRPNPSQPIPSHPIPSHPIPSHPISTAISSQLYIVIWPSHLLCPRLSSTLPTLSPLPFPWMSTCPRQCQAAPAPGACGALTGPPLADPH